MKRLSIFIIVALCLTANLQGQNVNLDDGLVAYYPFNGNAKDESGNGHDGTVYGATLTEDRFGHANSAYYFDGNNDYIDIGENILFNDNKFCFSLWFLSENLDYNYHGIIGKEEFYTKYRSPGIWIKNLRQIHSGFGDGYTWNSIITDNIFSENTWNYLVVQYNYESFEVYINGDLAYSTKEFANKKIYNTPVKFIGKVNNFFKGKLDDIRIYNRALNEDEIKTLYYGLRIIAPNGGEALYKFSTFTIKFEAPGSEYVNLDYSTDNGQTWQSIVKNYPANKGNYLWQVPDVSSNQCKIRVTDSNNANLYDETDGTFSIITAPKTLQPGSDVLSFPIAAPNSTTQAKLLLKSIGTSVVTVNGLTTNTSSFSVTNQSFSIESGQSKLISVSFSPDAEGYFSDTLTVLSDAVNSPLKILLIGTTTNWLSCQIDYVSDLTPYPSGVINIHYTTKNSNSRYLGTINWQYSTDGFIWHDIDAFSISHDEVHPVGSYYISWDSEYEKGYLYNQIEDSVYFRMQVTDGPNFSNLAVSAPFKINNNHRPSGQITAIKDYDKEPANAVKIYVHGSDPDGDRMHLANLQYLKGNNTVWQTVPMGHLSNTSLNSDGQGIIIWNTNSTLPHVEDLIRIRLKLNDGENVSSDYATFDPFPIDNNSPPTVEALGFVKAQGDSLEFAYRLKDEENDTCSIVCFYSLDQGKTWKAASFYGAKTNIKPGADYHIYWRAKQDLGDGFENENVYFKVEPRDHDKGQAAVEQNVEVDYNEIPEAKLYLVPGTITGDRPINYSLTDKENDPLSIKVFYKLAGDTGWHPATVNGKTENITGYDGKIQNFTWKVMQDVPNTTPEGTTVELKVVPYDYDEGIPGITPQPAKINTNLPTKMKASGSVGGNQIKIQFNEKMDGTTVIRINNWKTEPALTIERIISQNSQNNEKYELSMGNSDGVSGYYRWLDRSYTSKTHYISIKVDANNIHDDFINKFKILGYDDNENEQVLINKEGNLGNSLVEELNNIYFKKIKIYISKYDAARSPDGSGTVTVELTSASELPDKDFILYLVENQIIPNNNITISATNLKDSVGHTVDKVSCVLIPDDGNGNPIIKLEKLEGEYAGEVTINYQITDKENDATDLDCYYRILGQKNRQVASVIGETKGITNFSGAITWDSARDIPGKDVKAWFIIKPHNTNYDDLGEADSILIHVDNNQPPVATVLPLTDLYLGDVPVSFTLSDPESDTLNVSLKYSLDGNVWLNGTVQGKTTGYTADSYQGSIIWKSKTDLPETSDTIQVAIIPWDKDQGQEDITSCVLNNAGKVFAQVLDSFPSEVSGDVPIYYQINDPTGQNQKVNLHCAFSTDNGLSWNNTTHISGDTTDIDSSAYRGHIIWHSRQDLPGIDLSTIRFKIIPMTAVTGFSQPCKAFHLDNNEPPKVVSITLPANSGGVIPISYRITDAENDSIQFTISFKQNNSRWTTATLLNAGHLPPQGTLYWKAYADIGYGHFDNLRIKLIPYDNDPGQADSSSLFKADIYAGDYDGDLRVNDMDDLIEFALGWRTQDLSKEIGPARGELPWLIPQKDGRFDFEDLAVFTQMWNYFYTHAQGMAELGKVMLDSLTKMKTQNPTMHISFEQTHQDNKADLLTLAFNLPHQAAYCSMELFIEYDSALVAMENYESPFPLFQIPDDCYHAGLMILDSTQSDKEQLLQIRFRQKEGGALHLKLGYRLFNLQGKMAESGFLTQEFQLKDIIPRTFAVQPAYPNPFNPVMTLAYQLPEAMEVQIMVYDILGRKVAELHKGKLQAGYYKQEWNASTFSSGIYVMVLKAGKHINKQKVVLLK